MMPDTERVALILSARQLVVDGWAIEAIHALGGAGIPAVLLKGPSLAAWLYDEPWMRGYDDADLLVPPGSVADAERVLESLGYGQAHNVNPTPPGVAEHARPWKRPADGAVVDLHHTLSGAATDPAEVWQAAWEHTERQDVAGHEVPVLAAGARALLVCLHAAQHEDRAPRPLEDLRRAVARIDEGVWRQAAALAGRLSASKGMAAGLRMLPEGDALADRLGLPTTTLVTSPGPAFGFETLSQTRGARARARLLWREAFPSAGFLRWWLPWSRGGRLRLAAARVYRLGWLVVQGPRGYVAWRRSRRGAA